MKIWLTGARGFLGGHIRRLAVDAGHEVFLEPSSGCEAVIHCAGHCFGIQGNITRPADMISNNGRLDMETLDIARKFKIPKFVGIGSGCCYSDESYIPFQERDYFRGNVEPTNAAYAHAKRFLLAQLEAFYKQYGLKYAYPILGNLYGPDDHFDDPDAHVIPSMISRMVNAKDHKMPTLELWGDGTPIRDFLYVEDAARAVIHLAESDHLGPKNVATGQGLSIWQLAVWLKDLTGYSGELVWQRDKPNGQSVRILAVPTQSTTMPILDGLRLTVQSYVSLRATAPV